MAKWMRFEHQGKPGFGLLQGDQVKVYNGDMFNSPAPAGESLSLHQVQVLPPTKPTKIIALWNNYHALGKKLGLDVPPEPLYFIKTNNCILNPGGTIHCPEVYAGKVVFEGEIVIAIGKRARSISEEHAGDYIFGYTIMNDVTAAEILFRDSSFAQWVRAKSFDTFGPFGPVVETEIDPMSCSVVTVLNGDERQNYPVSDIIVPPKKLVSFLSQEMTLEPGDVISVGTSVGVGSMKPGSTVSVTIDGIGSLVNEYAG